jgi:2-polyprenyl-6-methoxyphenol hydroxylase-like FAD-dependent oxidoreductase
VQASGGLALAIRLAMLGGRPTVFEARSEAAAAREGVFLTLAPNGTNALRAIGCYEPVVGNGIDTTGIEILNAKGRRLALADQSDHQRVFGAPSVTFRRGLLAEILLARARAIGVDVRSVVGMTPISSSPPTACVPACVNWCFLSIRSRISRASLATEESQRPTFPTRVA